jgi:hypothetical protein
MENTVAAPNATDADSRWSPWGQPPAPMLDPRPFAEAHWQGIEAIPATASVTQVLGIPQGLRGVVIDDVSLPADLQGFQAGDLIMEVGGQSTPDLLSFVRASEAVRDQKQVDVLVYRSGQSLALTLAALFERLGTANGETPTMIPPGSRRPHRYLGPCTSCHRIGTTGSLATDPGDTASKSTVAIRYSTAAPHRDRGPCSACHQILQ